MSLEAVVNTAPRSPAGFASYHKRDRDLFLAMAAMIWAGMFLGFGSDLARHFATPHVAYPPVVYFHAVAFGGWLVVFTTQIWLIRGRRLNLHRQLGTLAVALAAIMIALGPATAFAMQRARLGTSESDPPFLASQLLSILSFAGLAAWAFAARRNPSAHKRLMLLATLAISDAGFARWLGSSVNAVLGSGFIGTLGSIYLGSDTLVVGLGVYDLATRRRLHPAYVVAVVWMVAIQLAATALVRDPQWKAVALALIGR